MDLTGLDLISKGYNYCEDLKMGSRGFSGSLIFDLLKHYLTFFVNMNS